MAQARLRHRISSSAHTQLWPWDANVRGVKLLSMLVPLDTLAGWPAAQEPTVLETLGLLVGAPLLVFFIVAGIAKIGNTVKAGRGEAPPVADSIWVGGRQGGGEIEAAPELHGMGAEDADRTPGGAGARW